ncbi:hypothetical protein BG004_002807, partial [Podila humilis]
SSPKFPLCSLRTLSQDVRQINIHTTTFPAPSITATCLRELDISGNLLDDYKGLIVANRQISSLKILGFRGEKEECEAISPLTAVKTLEFKNLGVVRRKGLKQVLANCRDVLEELSFSSPYNLNEMTDLAEPFDNMRLMKFDGDLAMNAGFFSLVRRCPNLKRLEVDAFKHVPSAWKGLGDHCPNLRSVVLRVQWLDECHVARILSLECRSLTEISVTVRRFSSTMKEAFLAHSESLEHLEVVQYDNSKADIPNTIELLRMCPKLKSLNVHHTTRHKAECSEEQFNGPWASTALETIKLKGWIKVSPAATKRKPGKEALKLKKNFRSAWASVSQEDAPESNSTIVQRLAKKVQDVPTMRAIIVDGRTFSCVRR